MKLKTGDLVLCVASPAFPQFEGRVFTLTTPCAFHAMHWDTDPPQFAPGYRLPVSFFERDLRLIRPSEGEDEMLRIAGRPVKEVA